VHETRQRFLKKKPGIGGNSARVSACSKLNARTSCNTETGKQNRSPEFHEGLRVQASAARGASRCGCALARIAARCALDAAQPSIPTRPVTTLIDVNGLSDAALQSQMRAVPKMTATAAASILSKRPFKGKKDMCSRAAGVGTHIARHFAFVRHCMSNEPGLPVARDATAAALPMYAHHDEDESGMQAALERWVDVMLSVRRD